jgi:hypothetical protein
MAELSEEARERRRKRKEEKARLRQASQPTTTPVSAPAPRLTTAPVSAPIPPEEDERGLAGTLFGGLERATRIGGLAVGTLASLPLGAPASALGIDLPWFPDPGKTPEAFGAFMEQVRKGDWDAAIDEYQEALDAGKYYWGASEAAGAFLPFGAPAFAGARLAAAAPKLAGTLGKLGAGARTVSGAERAMRGAGKTLRLPWEAEEAVGRVVGRGIGRGAGALGRAAGISRFRRPATEAAEEFVEQAAPIADEFGWQAGPTPGERIWGPTPEGPWVHPYARFKSRGLETTPEDLFGIPIGPRRALTREEELDVFRQEIRGQGGRKPPGTPVDTPRATGQGPRPRTISADPRRGFKIRGTDPDKLPGLTWRNNYWSKAVNQFNDAYKSIMGRERIPERMRRTGGGTGVVEAAVHEKKALLRQLESHQAMLGTFIRQGMRVFNVNKDTGLIMDESLSNVLPIRPARVDIGARAAGPGRPRGWSQVSGGQIVDEPLSALNHPTIQDVAARMDTYRQHLTDEQLKFMDSLRDIFENGTSWSPTEGVTVEMPGWNAILREGRENWSEHYARPDIEPGGFFLTRGLTKYAGEEASDLSISFRLKNAVNFNRKTISENPSHAPSMSGAIAAGHRYDPFDQAMVRHIGQVGDRLADLNIIGATKMAQSQLTATGRIGTRITRKIEGSDLTLYDDEVAVAFNRLYERKSFSIPVLREINQIYRGLKATADFSALGIHGAFAAFRKPTAWARAAKVSIGVFTKPGRASLDFADELLITKDVAAKAEGLFGSDVWASIGLRIGGAATEYQIPGMARLAQSSSMAARLPADVLDRFNRSFGAFGDNLRLEWANDLLRAELRKGRTLDEIWRSGDAGDMASIANKLTGWSDTRFGGDIGDIFLFAPRYFQSRLETYVQALAGIRGLRVPTAEALGRIGETRVTMRGIRSPVLESIGRKQTVQGREAAHTIMRMVGYGVALTEILNHVAGHETDRRPWVDGRPNPNFYTIRIGGQDFSLFGPSIGFFQAVASTVTGNPHRALRSLGSGSLRLAWDNFGGYTFIGEEALITRDEEGAPRFTDAGRAMGYFMELTLPIAPTQVAGQLGVIAGQIPGAARELTGGLTEEERVGPSPLARIGGGLVATAAETIGGRVSPMSRTDWQNQIAKELYDTTYDDLDAEVRVTVDSLVTERYGERVYRGPKGHLYEKKDKAKTTFISGLEAVSEKWLSASPGSTKWSPLNAKKGPGGYNELREARIERLYGFWDPEKGRLTGGLYDRLYDMDEEREEPELRTREHRVWQYYQIFKNATNPDSGEIDWDEVDKLECAFWASLTDPELDELLANIRVIEGEYPEAIQRMVDAGRYAGSLELNIAGTLGTYYDLESNPVLIEYIMRESGKSRFEVEEYLELPYLERVPAGKAEPGESIQEALVKASREGGTLYELKEEFVRQAGDEWKWAMMDSARSYRGSAKIEKSLYKAMQAGTLIKPEINYDALYRGILRSI